MSTKYEYFETGTVAQDDITSSTYFDGQTFSPALSHTITSVKLYLNKSPGTTGTLTVSIRTTSGGLPTGADLCSGTYNIGSIASNTWGWYEITFGAGTPLTAGTPYAIVNKSLDISGDLRVAASSAGYASGSMVYYFGGSWNNNDPFDLYFEDWGNPTVTYVDVTGEIDIISGLSGTPTVIIQVSGTIIIISGLSGRLSSNSIRWVQPRPFLYDSDVFWDEDTKTWTGTDGNSGGRYKSNLVVVGQTSTGTGCLYYGEI
jgi:hypothetical protein